MSRDNRDTYDTLWSLSQGTLSITLYRNLHTSDWLCFFDIQDSDEIGSLESSVYLLQTMK
ncbi:MAG: hypothetical protein ACFFAZ_00020 [Promethearchaeota archaeon]